MIIEQHNTAGLVINSPSRTKKLGVTNFGKIAGFLQNALYSDKELAVVREYSTNALDAHVEAGCPTRPIVIKLPNRFNPVFAVRDFGRGMDEDRIWRVFCNYGESTKDTSNDEIGMMGIGSKSAFAYGKSFTVVSFRNGIRKSYVCHTGSSAQGDFVELGAEETTEENGVEIQVPVQVCDIDTFVQKSAEFFAHWPITPIFEGNNIDIPKVEKVFEGDGWYFPKYDQNRGSKKPMFMMGNIGYQFPGINQLKAEQFAMGDDKYRFSKMLDLGLVVTAPIGSVDIATNRETLQLTDKTLTTIWKVLNRVRLEVETAVSKEFDALPTNYERMMLRQTYADYASPMYSYQYLLPEKYSSLNSFFKVDYHGGSGFTSTTYRKSRRGDRKVMGTSNRYEDNLHLHSNKLFLIDNSNGGLTKTQVRNRVLNLLERSTNQFNKQFSEVRVLAPTNPTVYDVWVKSVGFDVPLVDVSTLPEFKPSVFYPTAVAVTSNVKSVNTDKNSKKFLALNMKHVNGSNADYFTPAMFPKNPVEKIPFIVIDRYQVKLDENSELAPYDFIQSLNTITSVFPSVKIPDYIVAVRTATAKEIDYTNFVPLMTYINDQVSTLPNYVDKLAEIMFRGRTRGFKNTYITDSSDTNIEFGIVSSELAKLIGELTIGGILHDTLTEFNKLKTFTDALGSTPKVDECADFVKMFTRGDVTLLNKVNAAYDKLIENFVAGLKLVEETYPMISVMDSYTVRHIASTYHEKAKDTLVKYINFVDSVFLEKKNK